MIANSVGEGAVYGSGRLLDDLVEYVYSGEHCRLILLGDTAQLPPVGQERSPGFGCRRHGRLRIECRGI